MASKKSFAKGENPALMYITSPAQNTQNTQNTQSAQNTSNKERAGYTHNTQKTQDTQKAQKTSKPRQAHIVQNTHKAVKTDNAYNTDNAQYTHTAYTHMAQSENKSKRLNLLIRPSLHAQVQKIAHIQRSSVNDVVNLALAAYIAEHTADIGRYDSLYGK